MLFYILWFPADISNQVVLNVTSAVPAGFHAGASPCVPGEFVSPGTLWPVKYFFLGGGGGLAGEGHRKATKVGKFPWYYDSLTADTRCIVGKFTSCFSTT